ncbi:DUF1178 family protein [Sneathiella chinensis]|uniref:DUF1178 family protein n=1 Tax=Sneathiella chinensis TaxID=349750 RepID=A0ABQ5U8J8_9PROT|nr:DUF1178 family protein [Sneathiella chinensis]GLQ08045.1 hypothetical protein GCM10007924_32670 [Sneathiella chinensis]
MIKYSLKCEHDHVFEAWFSNSASYDEQEAKGIVQCSLCGSSKVTKALMAPAVPRKGRDAAPRQAPADAPSEEAQQAYAQQMSVAMSALRELRKTVEANCDYVGNNFAEEARKIHYGETEERGIYGEATQEERQELQEEGVEVAAIPWLPNTDA